MNKCEYCARFVFGRDPSNPYRPQDLFSGGCRGMGADANRRKESPCGGRLFMAASEWKQTVDGRFERREKAPGKAADGAAAAKRLEREEAK